jgi:hypothetical protein
MTRLFLNGISLEHPEPKRLEVLQFVEPKKGSTKNLLSFYGELISKFKGEFQAFLGEKF